MSGARTSFLALELRTEQPRWRLRDRKKVRIPAEQCVRLVARSASAIAFSYLILHAGKSYQWSYHPHVTWELLLKTKVPYPIVDTALRKLPR